MAAITSTQTGLWTDGSTWVGGVAPGNNDTFTIAVNHTVTIPDGANIIVGTSGPTGTEAGRMTGTVAGQGKLIVGQTTGATLTLRGDLILADAYTTRVVGRTNLTINAGSTLTFDASQAATPLSQIYVIGPSATNTPNNNVLISGTQALPVTITSNQSGGNGRFSIRGVGTRTGRLTATWCNFSRLGDASNAWAETSLNNATVDADTFSLTDCTLDYCGHENQSVALNDGTVYTLTRVRRTNSLATTCMRVVSNALPTTASTRACTDCAFDVPVGNSTNMGGFTFTRCLFNLGLAISAHASTKYSMVDCFIRKANTSGVGVVDVVLNLGGDLTRIFYLIDHPTKTNCKWWGTTGDYDLTLNGGHYENMSTADTTGELVSVVGANPASVRNITIKNHTVAFTPDGNFNERPGTLWSIATSAANYAFYTEHNTWIGSTEPTMSIGETASSPAGVIKTYKSNITYSTRSPVGSGQYHILDRDANGTNAQLAAAATDIDYNCGVGLKTGSDGVGYQLNCAGTPGANDVNVSPGFVDPTRTLAKWNSSRGGTETTAAALVTLAADPSLITAAYAWCQGGWAPTNTALKGTAHDGGDIGAVAVIVPSGGRPGGFPTLGSPGPAIFGSSNHFGRR